MVQGLPAVDWKKPENNAKLFAAVLALVPGTPDYKKIAAAFGPNVPANAISYRLGVVRKEGAAMGFTPGSGSFSPTAKSNGNITTPKRVAPAAVKQGSKGKARKRANMAGKDTSDDPDTAMDSEEEESAAETDAEKNPTTSTHSAKHDKTIGGRIIKRISPRKGKKTNYKALVDPFFTMDEAKDEKGNNVSGEPSGTESEDTYATDGSFKESGKVAVKIEDAA